MNTNSWQHKHNITAPSPNASALVEISPELFLYYMLQHFFSSFPYRVNVTYLHLRLKITPQKEMCASWGILVATLEAHCGQYNHLDKQFVNIYEPLYWNELEHHRACAIYDFLLISGRPQVTKTLFVERSWCNTDCPLGRLGKKNEPIKWLPIIPGLR